MIRLESSRRSFLKTSFMAGLAAGMTGFPLRKVFAVSESVRKESSRAALTAGDDRTDNIFQGLKAFEKEIKQAIGNRRVVIKPNNVHTKVQLCATHADCLKGILEFLKSIDVKEVTVAECAASGPSMEGFSNYGYLAFEGKYPVKFVDLDKEPFEIVQVLDERDVHPWPVRMSSLLLDPKTFIISSAVMKTHDRVITTLSLKNIVVGAPIKDEGFSWGGGKKGAKNDKPIVHGGGYRGINYNLYALAPRLHPHLAVIDGYQGMQGNGPVSGTPVDHKVAVVSADWLAADRVAAELMGIDFAKIGYLNYCAQAGYGQADLQKIEILGPAIKDHVKPYKLSDSIEKQLAWMKSDPNMGPW